MNEHGTFEAEMEALDRLDEQEQQDPEEGMKKEFYHDPMGDVRSGVPGVSAEVVTRPLWSRRAAAAKSRWQDPAYRSQVMSKRAETKRRKEEEKLLASNATAVKRRGRAGKGKAKAKVRLSGVKHMKQNQNEWMSKRLEEGRIEGNQSLVPLKRRIAKRKSYRDAALRRAGSESSGAIGLSVLLTRLNLLDLKPPLIEAGMTVDMLANASVASLERLGASRADAKQLSKQAKVSCN